MDWNKPRELKLWELNDHRDLFLRSDLPKDTAVPSWIVHQVVVSMYDQNRRNVKNLEFYMNRVEELEKELKKIKPVKQAKLM